jgi:hypothetical protein
VALSTAAIAAYLLGWHGQHRKWLRGFLLGTASLFLPRFSPGKFAFCAKDFTA